MSTLNKIVSSDVSLKKIADTNKKTSNDIVKSKKNKIKLNDARIVTKKNKDVIKALAKSALLFTTSKILNNQITKLSKTVQQLSELVDKVNDQIRNIKTQQDVIKARNARDAALLTLSRAERQIIQVQNIIKILERILFIISNVLRLLLLVQIPTTPIIVQKITNTILTLDSLTIIVSISKSALNDLLIEVRYQKSRLLPISDIIDNIINNNLSPKDIETLLKGNNKIGELGIVEGIIYKGFTFAIYEENDPKFVVEGNKRRYAVALDRSGFMVLQSNPSFTLNPSVLIEQLKLIIDEQNLEP
jgi:hypothetical protein